MARMLLDPPNFLVLDEPTNHLDLETKEMLVEALKEFEGTMLFVSHDRTFLKGLGSRVLELEYGEDGERRPHIYPGPTSSTCRRRGARRRGCMREGLGWSEAGPAHPLSGSGVLEFQGRTQSPAPCDLRPAHSPPLPLPRIPLLMTIRVHSRHPDHPAGRIPIKPQPEVLQIPHPEQVLPHR